MMKTGKFKYPLILILILTTSGCEKYVSYVNAPEFIQKLVVTSFITPSDSVSDIFVSSNQPLYFFSDHFLEPGDLTGTISDGITEIQLDTTSSGLSFKNENMPIIPGNIYTIKISSSKNLHAEAVAIIPRDLGLELSLDTLSILHDDIYSDGPYTEFRMTASFRDIPGETNYYKIYGKFTGFKKSTGLITETYVEIFMFEKYYFKDLIADNNDSIKLDGWFYRSYNYYDSAFVSVYLLNTEESYYLYHTSLNEFDRSDNPFSEAKPVYSNIEGGLGIFTSYTIDSLVFRLK